MDRIQDRANKIFYDVRKKKIKIGSRHFRKDIKETEEKDNTNISNVTANNCLYCEKVFVNSNYLLKHIFRRHSENVIKLHRKCSQPKSSDSSDLNCLFTFLEEQFLELKSEISTMKKNMGQKDIESKISPLSEKETTRFFEHVGKGCNENTACNSLASNDVETLKEKVNNIENNIQSLRDKFEELDSTLQTEVMFKSDFHKHKILSEEKFLREQEIQFAQLRQVLLKELRSVLSKELHESNMEYKSKVSDLKHDILMFEHVIADIKKQVDSPDFMLAIEKRLEDQIINFLGTTRQHSSKRRHSRARNKLSINKSQNSFVENKMASKNHNFDHQIVNSPHSKTFPQMQEEKSILSHTIPDDLSFLVTEKLSYFKIPPGTSRVTNAEFNEKMELINSDYEYLCKKYPNFSEIRCAINTIAHHRVLSELKNRKSRKLRFSDPLILNKNISHSSEMNASHFLNETYPLLKSKKLKHSVSNNYKTSNHETLRIEKNGISVSKEAKVLYHDTGGSGDYYGLLSKRHDFSVKEMDEQNTDEDSIASSPINHQSVKEKSKSAAAKEFKTSSPIDHVSLKEKSIEASAKECSSPLNHRSVKEKKKYSCTKDIKTSSSSFIPHEAENLNEGMSNGHRNFNFSVLSDYDENDESSFAGGKISYPVLNDGEKYSSLLTSSKHSDRLDLLNQISELEEDEDGNSVKSLSDYSWEDEDEPFVKDGPS